jgi:DHA1 family tetracycline resistance protein-like MFS transporter
VRSAAPSALFLAVFIDLMGFGIVIPLLPIYAERLHATPFAAGGLIAVYSLMQLAFAPVWGRLSDRVGRRPVLLVSLLGSAVSYLLLAGAWSIEMLFAARLLAGVAGANIPVAQAYIADVTTGAERAGGMGMIGAAFGLGMVIGPAIGGGLSLVGPRVPELFAAALCVANVAIAFRGLPESLPPSERRVDRFQHPLSRASLRDALAPSGAATLLGLFFLVTLCFAVLEGTFSLAAVHRYGYSAAQVDGLWLYMGVVAVVVQGRLVGLLAARVPERRLVVAGTAALALGLLWLAFAGGGSSLLGALALVIGGHGLASPSLSSLISRTALRRSHGGVLGVSQSLSAGGRVLGPAGGGLLLDRLGPAAPYLAAAACAAGALALVLPGARTGGRSDDQATAVRRSG